jgi:hypothetical protein
VVKTDQSGAVWEPSPNYWAGRAGHEPSVIVCHGTAGSAPGCVNWLCNPQSGASAHYVVTRDGTTYQLVAEQNSSWANGIPEPPSLYMRGANPNLFSISIEAERPASDNSTPLTEVQTQAIIRLVAGIRARWGPLPLVPHSTISPLSRARCPGPDYPMARIDHEAQIPHSHITWTRFTGLPTHVPLIFYSDASFKRPLYRSQANERTELDFDAWQLGERVNPGSSGHADERWYHRHNPQGQQGWCPAAYINGGPK